MSFFNKKRFLVPLIFLVLAAAGAGVAYKEKYRVKKFIKKRPFLYKQAVELGRLKHKVFGDGGGKGIVRDIDTEKAVWNLVFDADRSLGTYKRFWGNLGFESFKSGVLNGRSRQLFNYIKDSNRRLLSDVSLPNSRTDRFDRQAFRYLRAHNLYSNGKPPWGEGLDIYQVDSDGKVYYDWRLTDQVFDAMLEVGFKPLPEFGFMPDALASIPDRRQRWGKANISPPKDYKQWQNLVYQTVRHFVARYGAQEVASWYFEVWNEPDLGWLFWIEDSDPSRKPYGDLKEYHKLYDLTVAAAKSAFPQIRVGGPASAGGDINLLLEYLYAHSNGKYQNYSPIDFVSSHAYGNIGYDFRMNRKTSLISKLHWKLASSVEHDLGKIKELMQTMPFLLTETGPKYNKRIINEGRFVAAWYAKMVDSMFYIGDEAGEVYRPREVVYWSAHQVVKDFEQNKGGIAAALKLDGHSAVFKLPVYNVMEALGYLSDERITLVSGSQFGETVHAIATKNTDKSVEILLYHIDEDIDERTGKGSNLDSLMVRISVANLPFERFEVQHYAIDETHSNTFSVWLKMGKPEDIQRREYEVLRKNQNLALWQPVRTERAGASRSFQRDIAMQSQSVHLLRLVRK